VSEELLRAWVRDHQILVDSTIALVVLLTIAVRVAWWFHKTDIRKAKTELLESVHRDPVIDPPARPLDGRTMRVASLVLAVLGVVAVALAVAFSWTEFQWLGAEVVRAPFIDSTVANGSATARYRVQSTTRPPFIASFSFTPRYNNWTGVDEAMRVTHVVEIHRGDPLRYREYERSTSKNARGWWLIKLNAGLGAMFGGLFLLFAFKLHRAAVLAEHAAIPGPSTQL
jgi:uncharacterized membrane protein